MPGTGKRGGVGGGSRGYFEISSRGHFRVCRSLFYATKVLKMIER